MAFSKELRQILTAKLESSPPNETTGTVESDRDSGRNMEVLTLGGYYMHIAYSGVWRASAWHPAVGAGLPLHDERTVATVVQVTFSFSDRWDFKTNSNYTFWQNLSREWIPYIAFSSWNGLHKGRNFYHEGLDFIIEGTFTLPMTMAVKQASAVDPTTDI